MSSKACYVLFVDDDENSTQALIRSLGRHGARYECLQAGDAVAALQIAEEKHPEVAVVDLTLDPSVGPESGFSLISRLFEIDPSVRVLVLTGHGSEELGIRALQGGAASFLTKPVDLRHLHALIEDGISFAALRRRYSELSADTSRLGRISGLQGTSPAMLEVMDAVLYAASNKQPVLISGETGTGKGVVAQAIHRIGKTSHGPFIRVQPSFGSHDLITSEIFGHHRGAFTGATETRAGLIEEANGGTLFIDEVDELPHETQVLLLNVLQERIFRRIGSNKLLKSDFRLIAATNREPETLLKSGKLREDFYHRIAHFAIEIPPLRRRLEDIHDLAFEFVRDISNRDSLPVQGLTQSALAKLASYDWPGNVRELQAVVQGGVYRANYAGRRFVDAADLLIRKKKAELGTSSLSFRERVQKYEVQLIREALARNGNNQSRAAESLKMDRSTMRRILAREGEA